MATKVKYPIGEQSFEQLRKGGYLYVDKTPFIEKLIEGPKYYFLGRPRRFGKSLFINTLKCFFEGKRELFKGLYIDSIDWDWEEYPVFRLDLNTRRFQDDANLEVLLNDFLTKYEAKYGIERPETDLSGRFGNLIESVAKKTGKNVVILVDEYDKPLVNNLHNREKFEHFRSQLAEIYSHFKSDADYIRLVFITGVSRFGKLSLFSDINNINDLSFDDQYAAVCGITETELKQNFTEGIQALADKNNTTPVEELERLKHHYDGYHFVEKSEDIYNPFSLINTFDKATYKNYWISSGTPTLLLEQLKRTKANLSKAMEPKIVNTELEGLDIDNMKTIPLLFQTGYLTIKGSEARGKILRLGIPNDEVKEGFLEYLLPTYANLHDENSGVFVYELQDEIVRGEVDAFMKRLRSLFSDTSYELRMDEELNVQNALFILFKLIGIYVDAEYRTSEGRIDILLRTNDYVYIMELKYDKSAREALDQIERKGYALPWSIDDRKIIAIGINISKSKRTIDEWVSKTINP